MCTSWRNKMPQCAVATCTNSHRKTRGAPVRYHRFPADATTRQQWIRVCGRQSLNAATARVCSRHFSAKSYERDVQHELLGLPTRTRLRKGAVPDKFVVGEEPRIRDEPYGKDSAIAVLLAVGLMPANATRRKALGGLPQEWVILPYFSPLRFLVKRAILLTYL